MFTLAYMFLGLFSFTAGTAVIGTWLRRHPSRINAERSSRLVHLLFFAGEVTPGIMILLYPGPARLDQQVGLSPLPRKRFFLALGLILALPGLYLIAVSNQKLHQLGSGANAFRLTKRLVLKNVYRYIRNPMSLGFYLLALGIGLVGDSSFITLISVLGVIPAHLFFLKYFEELELELRFGSAYLEYKRRVPFLIPRFGSHSD